MCIRDSLWGVIHNGVSVYENANKFLGHAHKKNISVFFISNAPRPETVVRKGLTNKLHLNEKYYEFIFTSGDTGAKHINELKHGESYFHVGPDKDEDLLDTINIKKNSDYEIADFILCTGLFDDHDNDLNYYRKFLEKQISKKLVCTNPDLTVHKGNIEELCAGSVAKVFEELGGKVIYYGKPHKEIYSKCFDKNEIVLYDSINDLSDKIKFYKKNYKINGKFLFKHGKKYYLPDGKLLFSSYHPSPRNVNTGVLNQEKMKNICLLYTSDAADE